MAFIVGENCINCKHTDCVKSYPVDCFFEGPNFLVIDPEEWNGKPNKRKLLQK